ncbi:MAG: TetR family transcriptional regulator C-terminal domain-containing protein [Cyanophyceae cyanobacterium]
MKKEATRTRLLTTGEQIFLEKGYNHTGIQEVLKSAGVPKGSFYYYFKSKEEFGLSVIEASNAAYSAKLDGFFQDESRTPLARLRNYFKSGIRAFEDNNFRCGCLVGNMSQEMASQNETFRVHLNKILTGWRERFAQCLQEAQNAGEISADWDVQVLANFCIDGWEGAIMRAKVAKSTEPMEAFISIVFDTLFTAKPSPIPA